MFVWRVVEADPVPNRVQAGATRAAGIAILFCAFNACLGFVFCEEETRLAKQVVNGNSIGGTFDLPFLSLGPPLKFD